MKKRSLLVILALVVVMSLSIGVPASACTAGCTPGYWKNHTDAWVGYSTEQTFVSVFEVGPADWPEMTLLEALSARNKDVGSGVEAAMIRHAVAALLNGASLGPPAYEPPHIIINYVVWAYSAPHQMEHVKNIFEGWNELGCPLN